MNPLGKDGGIKTPVKDRQARAPQSSKRSENSNPNFGSPGPNPSSSPVIKFAKSEASPRNKIRQRKFVVAKKNPKNGETGTSRVECKCNGKGGCNVGRCLCVAYVNLRASQEDFSKNQGSAGHHCDLDQLANGEGDGALTEPHNQDPDETEFLNSSGKRRREELLEEARDRMPEPGSGRVMHLVKTFESILSIPKSNDSDQKEGKEQEDVKKGMKWALAGLWPKAPNVDESLASLRPSEMLLTAENLGLNPQLSSSRDSGGHESTSSCTASGGRRNRRNSRESSGTTTCGRGRREPKVTSQRPFLLRTEERGRLKEEEFNKKLQEMMTNEEKQRVPIAQGLPWTTDEPECLIKPEAKDCTRPLDIKLHSDVRAVERADFDNQVTEKLSLIEQYRMERERQQKLEEEEEIRRLRKELVPKAQPMPYFDRPFIPRRSLKDPTIPKEPKFNDLKKIKGCCNLSWNDIHFYNHLK